MHAKRQRVAAMRPGVREVAGQAVLLTPLAFLLVLVLTNAVGVAGAVVGVFAAALVGSGLHVLAVATARRLRSDKLPWLLWGLTAATVWLFATGVIAVGRHFADVDAGVNDGVLFVPAMIAAGCAAAVAVAAAVVAVVIGIRVIRGPGAARLAAG